MLNARLLLLALVGLATAAPAATVIAPLRPQLATTLYLVGDGAPATARLTVTAEAPGRGVRALLRAFDPAEALAYWHYVEAIDPRWVADLEPREEITLLDPATVEAGQAVMETTVDLSAPGVHQVRLSAGGTGCALAVELSRDLPFGVSGQNGDHRPWDGAPSTFYVYVPPHAEVLELRGGPATLRDAGGAVLAELPAKGSASVPVTQTETTWRLDVGDDWVLRAAGFPFILCPTPEAAAAIQGSVRVLDDGTVVAHAFQQRIHAMLPEILAPENVGTADALIVPLAEREEAWLADPQASLALKDAFLPAIEQWLRSQNVDPASHWSGSLDGWQDKIDQAPPGNRWDRLHGVDGLWGGASNHYGDAGSHLALGALLDIPQNPYFGKRELLYRAAAAALRDLTALAEDETWPGTADLDPYPGNMAFVLGQKTFPVFGLVAPHLPQDVQAVWTEGLRHIVDRSFPDYLVSARNQSSHYLVAFEAFANGSEMELYDDLIKLYARRWRAGQHPAGWHEEATGPDSSYIGMTHWHEGVYYQMSGDPVALDSLRDSYRFFNHTVAPEPDGRMLGGFNYNHRVGEGFYGEQWGGAKGIVSGVLPEVGAWAGERPSDEEARETLKRFLADPQHPRYPDHQTPRFLHRAEPADGYTFPALEPEPFVRNLNDQLIAVKRPGYYTTIFVGQPAAGEYYIRNREQFRQAAPGESAGGEPDMRKITPFLGGGLTGFWTPDYGHAVLAANWAPTTHHGLIATRPDGNRAWEDYYASSFVLDEAAGTLTVRGVVEGLPLRYERVYTFADDALEIELTLTADEAVELARLVENVPFPRWEWKPYGATLSAAGAEQGQVTADRITLTDERGEGVAVELAEERELALVPDGLKTGGWRRLQIGRVEIALPERWEAGRTETLRYRLVPLD